MILKKKRQNPHSCELFHVIMENISKIFVAVFKIAAVKMLQSHN